MGAQSMLKPKSFIFPGVMILVTAAWFPLVCGSSAWAGNLDDESFTFRFPAALSRFASYGDVAAVGGASAASKWGSAINPASIAWLASTEKPQFNLNPQYSLICFEEGTQLHVAAASGTISRQEWGTFQTTVALAASSKGKTKSGLDFDFDMDYYQIQWGKRQQDWAWGVNFNYAPTETHFDIGALGISKSHADNYGIRLGGLNQLSDKLRAGLVVDYVISRARTVLYDFMELGIGDIKIKDTSHQYLVRPGISYEYKEDSAIFLDYQYFYILDDTGSLEIHRLMTGIDHELIDGFFVRGGTAVDVEGNVALTGGVGIYPCNWLTIDVGYQYDMFPELDDEFGRSHTLVASLGLTF